LSPRHCVLAVTWVAKAGLETRIKHVLQNLALETRREPGCVAFIVHQEVTDPTRFLVYEVYRDSNALNAHSDSSHFKRYVLTEAAPLLDARQRVELKVITG
jgi:quinol monooxygenase YgiN